MTLRASLIRFTLATACTGFAAASMAQTAAPAGPDAKARMALEAAFTKADANGDGKITKDEAAKVPEISAKFDVLDKDKDGALTLAEFAAGFKAG
ncbi:MAG: EF-hand domain-containing protein [Piscinibacter sp.]